MRKMYLSILNMLVLLLLTITVISQKNSGEQQMTWTTKSKAARALALKGVAHIMNVEREQAYQHFSEALKLDPDFTVALAFMANLTTGQTKKDFAEKALKTAANKSEGEKLLASLVDEKNTQENRRDTWGKLHTMFPDDPMISHFYIVTRPTSDESFTDAQDYIKKFPDQPAMYNNLAYYYLQNKKDTAMAKQYFEKYITLYPEGANPYDSMGEFYLNTGDTANAEKYYNMALEKYPFMNSSVNALQKMHDEKKATDSK